MLMQLLAAVGCVLAALLQLAVYRDPTLVDTRIRHNGRRIIMVALIISALYSINALATAASPNAAFLILFLVALSQVAFAVSDLLPHLEKEHPWTSRLNSSP